MSDLIVVEIPTAMQGPSSLCLQLPSQKDKIGEYLCVAVDNHLPCINHPCIKTIPLSLHPMWHVETIKDKKTYQSWNNSVTSMINFYFLL